jgi:hypothetical protein
MFFINFIRFIYYLKKVDTLFFKQKANVIVRLRGRFGYYNEAKNFGEPVGKEFYCVPIFYQYRKQPLQMAIHEVRHRFQWNNPNNFFLTIEDVPQSLKPYIMPSIINKLSAREIDAQIFDEISLPTFRSNPDDFIKLMLGKIKIPKES